MCRQENTQDETTTKFVPDVEWVKCRFVTWPYSTVQVNPFLLRLPFAACHILPPFYSVITNLAVWPNHFWINFEALNSLDSCTREHNIELDITCMHESKFEVGTSVSICEGSVIGYLSCLCSFFVVSFPLQYLSRSFVFLSVFSVLCAWFLIFIVRPFLFVYFVVSQYFFAPFPLSLYLPFYALIFVISYSVYLTRFRTYFISFFNHVFAFIYVN